MSFFEYFIRDADAPMNWNDNRISFQNPPVLHSYAKQLLLISSKLNTNYLRGAFPDEEIEVVEIKPTKWCQGNNIYQIRTGLYLSHNVYEYDTNIDRIRLSKMGRRFFYSIYSEINRDTSVKHAIIAHTEVKKWMSNFTENGNVSMVTAFNNMEDSAEQRLSEADVIWIIGTPFFTQGNIWNKAQFLYGNDTKPLSYKVDTENNIYEDKRIQHIFEKSVISFFSNVIAYAKLTQLQDKKIVIGTSFPLPGITDRPETQLFDWEDLEVAGGLDKLPEAITTRERYEAESTEITAETSRIEVERILGCSSRQANRVLNKLRGGNIQRVSFREQILSLLSDGEKKTAELVEAIEGHPKAINSELTRLVTAGDIVKVRHGVYMLPEN